MKIQIIPSSKSLIIKPSTPTPPSLRIHKISAIDELAPKMNVPLVLYYPPPLDTHIFNRLKVSLNQTLTQFYPLAGRYVKEFHSIHCNDEGVEYVEAHVRYQLLEILSQRRKLKSEMLNNFIPCEIGAVDEVMDPLLAIQVTSFDCGGLALSVCVSHRIGDVATLSNFVNAWAAKSRGSRIYENLYPSFESASSFPGRNLRRTYLGIPRNISKGMPGVDGKMFFFSGKAISILREKAGGHSRVQLVFAFIWSVLLGIGRVKQGPGRASVVFQPVNLRGKTIPPIPKHSCGNIWGLAIAHKSETEDFQNLLNLLSDSVKKIAKDFGRVLCDSEEGQAVLMEPWKEVSGILEEEVSSYLFVNFCDFPFYEADFGWGKPVWVSGVNLRVKNMVVLMDEREGDGIEAWVHLDVSDMLEFEQDDNIRAFTT
ncbi:hypothetical protein LguiB_006898 [Lonicera macranthoides]